MKKKGIAIKGYTIDKKTGKLKKIDKRNLIQKLQSKDRVKWKPVGK
jgi:hypothetical protein